MPGRGAGILSDVKCWTIVGGRHLFIRPQTRFLALVLLTVMFSSTTILRGDKNSVLGELRLEGKSNVEKTSGVWVDGQYVGFLKELKGSKKVLLLPGHHRVTIRQDGYQQFTEQVLIQPGETVTVSVSMIKAPAVYIPLVKSEVKLDVSPSRAAVFVDGMYVGHVKEFDGIGRGMLVAPGPHHVSIALPGYESFETDIKPVANQKVQIKTDLMKSTGPPSGPLVSPGREEGSPRSTASER